MNVIHIDDVEFVYNAVHQPAVIAEIAEIAELVKPAEHAGVKLVPEKLKVNKE